MTISCSTASVEQVEKVKTVLLILPGISLCVTGVDLEVRPLFPPLVPDC